MRSFQIMVVWMLRSGQSRWFWNWPLRWRIVQCENVFFESVSSLFVIVDTLFFFFYFFFFFFSFFFREFPNKPLGQLCHGWFEKQHFVVVVRNAAREQRRQQSTVETWHLTAKLPENQARGTFLRKEKCARYIKCFWLSVLLLMSALPPPRSWWCVRLLFDALCLNAWLVGVEQSYGFRPSHRSSHAQTHSGAGQPHRNVSSDMRDKDVSASLKTKDMV